VDEGSGLENRSAVSEGAETPSTYEKGDSCLALCLNQIRQNRPDLASVVEAWDGLSEAVKAGILAMVEASKT